MLYLGTPGASVSGIIHLLARFKVVVLCLGIGGAVALYGTATNGPGERAGIGESLAAYEQQLLADSPNFGNLDAVMEGYYRVAGRDLSDAEIRELLKQIEPATDLKVRDVRSNSGLLEAVKLLRFLDLVREHGLDQAEKLF